MISDHSYKNIFNKSILWIKLYDNYLYLFLSKNTNNKFSLLEPKTKVNQTLITSSLSTLPANPSLKEVSSISNDAQTLLVTGAEYNKVQISKNTIKLINTNINNNNQEEKKEININKYFNSISKYDSKTVKYQNIVYQFNKKGIQNSSV